MALITEDGTGLTNSESFVSVLYFITYHNNRGNAFTATTGQIEAALRKATDYMESRWANSWVGIRHSTLQALSWPRDGAFYPDDGRIALGVPVEVQKACAEYALRALSNELSPDLEYTTSLGVVEETEDRVGPIMERRKYAVGGTTVTFRKFAVVDASLKQLMMGGSGSGYLERV